MKNFILSLLLIPGLSFAQKDGGGAPLQNGGFIDPGAGFGFFTSPPLSGVAKTLDLSNLQGLTETRGQCSFNVSSTQSATEAKNALDQVIAQCRPQPSGAGMGTGASAFDPLLSISRAFGDAATDPQSCFNYENTYDNLFRRIMQNPEIASGQMRSCTRDNGESYVADERCLFRMISELKETRRSQCEETNQRQARTAQIQAIQAGVTELNNILTGILSEDRATCPNIDDSGKARVIQTIMGTAAQLLSVPFAGTGIDLGIGLLSNGLSRLFSGSRDRSLQRIRDRWLNLDNFTTLACLHENLQNDVSNCRVARARFDNRRAESELQRLEGQVCQGTMAGISPNLENFLESITQIRQTTEGGSSACANPRSCVQNLLRNLSEKNGDGTSFAQVISSTAAENIEQLQERQSGLEDLNEMTSSERTSKLAELRSSGDPIFQQIAAEGNLEKQNKLITEMLELTTRDLTTAQTSASFIDQLCSGDCNRALSLEGRRQILANPEKVAQIVASIRSSAVDPVSAINSNLVLRTDIGLHSEAQSSLARFARQFTVSRQIRTHQQRIEGLRRDMFPQATSQADRGREKSLEILLGLESVMDQGGRSSMIQSQMQRIDNAVKSMQTTPQDCVGEKAQTVNCRSTRQGMFEGEIKTMFMICQQLHSLSSVNQGQANPNHPDCRRFSCAFDRFPSEVNMPQVSRDDAMANYRNVDYTNFICANFNQKEDRLNFLRDNFLRTGQVCPGSN